MKDIAKPRYREADHETKSSSSLWSTIYKRREREMHY